LSDSVASTDFKLNHSSNVVPIFYLQYKNVKNLPTKKVQVLLQKIVDATLQDGVAISRSRYSKNELKKLEPSIRITVSSDHTLEDIKKAVGIIVKNLKKFS